MEWPNERISHGRPSHQPSCTRQPIRTKYLLEAHSRELDTFSPGWTILHAPGVSAEESDGTNGDAFIITDLAGKMTIIGGTAYHGQIKKSIFSVQNFRLPLAGILTTHAGASVKGRRRVSDPRGSIRTGKTTLSNTGFLWRTTRSSLRSTAQTLRK